MEQPRGEEGGEERLFHEAGQESKGDCLDDGSNVWLAVAFNPRGDIDRSSLSNGSILTEPLTNPQLKQYFWKQAVQAAGKAPPVFFMIAQAKQVGYSELPFWVAI